MEERQYRCCPDILREELVPALGWAACQRGRGRYNQEYGLCWQGRQEGHGRNHIKSDDW